MMGWYGNGMGTSGWLVMSAMGVFWLILLGLIVWLVVRLLPGSDGGTTRPTGESALDILDRRLASGEIDLETWQAQRAASWAPSATGGDRTVGAFVITPHVQTDGSAPGLRVNLH